MTWGSGLILQRNQYNALNKTQSENHNQQTTIANHNQQKTKNKTKNTSMTQSKIHIGMTYKGVTQR